MGSRDSLADSASPVQANPAERPAAPLGAVLLLGTSRGIQQIPVQTVRRVSVPAARGKVIGLLSGATLDSVMLLLLFAALSQMDFS